MRKFCTNRLIQDEIEWYKIEDYEIPQIDFLDNQNVIGMRNSKILIVLIYEKFLCNVFMIYAR